MPLLVYVDDPLIQPGLKFYHGVFFRLIKMYLLKPVVIPALHPEGSTSGKDLLPALYYSISSKSESVEVHNDIDNDIDIDRIGDGDRDRDRTGIIASAPDT